MDQGSSQASIAIDMADAVSISDTKSIVAVRYHMQSNAFVFCNYLHFYTLFFLKQNNNHFM